MSGSGAPGAIYLQDGEHDPEEEVLSDYEGVTWCADSINDGDTKYIRFDLHEAALAARPQSPPALSVDDAEFGMSEHRPSALAAPAEAGETPRTDAIVATLNLDDNLNPYFVLAGDLADHARALERALASAKTEIENLAGSAEPLRTTLAEVKRQLASANAAREEMRQERDAAEDLRVMQLAGIMTVSFQNTRSTVADHISSDNPYWTQAYGDVCVAIDREIRQRERADSLESRLKAVEAALVELVQVDDLRKRLNTWPRYWPAANAPMGNDMEKTRVQVEHDHRHHLAWAVARATLPHTEGKK